MLALGVFWQNPDHICIVPSIPEEHYEHMRAIFETLNDGVLLLTYSTVDLQRLVSTFLQHTDIVSKNDITPSPGRVKDFVNIPAPVAIPSTFELLQEIHHTGIGLADRTPDSNSGKKNDSWKIDHLKFAKNFWQITPSYIILILRNL